MVKKKSLHEDEIELRKALIKVYMDDCLEQAKKEFDMTYKNYKEHKIFPYDLIRHSGFNAFQAFMIWAQRFSELQEIEHEVIKRKRNSRDRNKSKSS